MVKLEIELVEDENGYVFIEVNSRPTANQSLQELTMANLLMDDIGYSIIKNGGDSAQMITSEGDSKVTKESALNYFNRNS